MHSSTGLGFRNSKEKQQAGQDVGLEENSESDEDSDSDSDEDSTKSKHSSSRRKRAERKREEEQIAAREMSLLDGTAAPETVGDFSVLLPLPQTTLLCGSNTCPSNALLWSMISQDLWQNER